MADTASDAYVGTAVLETMEEARNYMASLVNLVLAEAPADGRVLDFGAGTGAMAAEVAAAGLAVECVEPDDTLRERIEATGHTTHAALPIEGGYDFIYSLNVLEHIADDDAQLRRLRAALVPGGRLLLYVPAFMCLYSPFDRAVGHHRRYTRDGLSAKLAAAGFVVERAAYADTLGFAAALAYRWLGPADGGLSRRGLGAYDRFAFPLSRWLDRALGGVIGKNLLVVATAP